MNSNSLDTKNVFGAQSGTLLKGPKTDRVSNPLEGNYQVPGWTELKDSDNPYSVTKKEDLLAKKMSSSTLMKTGAQQMGIQNGPQAVTGGLNNIPEHKQKEMMESYAKFYGVENDPKVAKLTYNKLYQASRTGGAADPMQAVPKEMREDPSFKHNQKKFF